MPTDAARMNGKLAADLTSISVRQPPPRKFKVKTGCITCRVRKVKCGEEKPSCKRCTDTGRKCDGYANLIANTVTRKAASVRPIKGGVIMAFHSHPGLSDSALGAEDRRWLDFFRRYTGPALSGVSDDDYFWTVTLPQLCHSESAVQHALVAVSSSHAWFQHERLAGDLTRTLTLPKRSFALQQYNKAIVQLRSRLEENSGGAQVTLICCLLFVCLECLYGNRETVLGHLKNGLQILNTATSNGQNVSNGRLSSDLHKIFDRLAAQSILFGNYLSEGSSLEDIMAPALAQVFPARFKDLLEAKSALEVICFSTLKFVQAADVISAAPCDFSKIQEYQMILQGNFLSWKHAFTSLLSESTSLGSAPSSDKREAMLHIHYTATLVWLKGCLSPVETIYDDFSDEFATIIAWTDFVTGRSLPTSTTADSSSGGTSMSVFALEQGLVPALYLTALKCRHPTVRRRAIATMEAIPGREGLWDAKLHARVAKRFLEIEESLAKSEGEFCQPVELFVPDHCRIRDARIVEDGEGSCPPSCSVTFYTLPQGIGGEWKVWEEKLHVLH